ncbi:MAG: hypothetical protein QOG21_2351 [Actinomycetota bacterium]|nr:hypothetical protein [Actinomycetota bacterium]
MVSRVGVVCPRSLLIRHISDPPASAGRAIAGLRAGRGGPSWWDGTQFG